MFLSITSVVVSLLGDRETEGKIRAVILMLIIYRKDKTWISIDLVALYSHLFIR